MFRVYWTNHDYFAAGSFGSLEEAKAFGIRLFMEFQVFHGETMVGYWTVFGGWRSYG